MMEHVTFGAPRVGREPVEGGMAITLALLLGMALLALFAG